ncbi:MAG TPA: DUF2089 domain-containing protein [Firmicutes bacterium]|nr:DUF2089 domain-containing protein [Bacillota bacterium]
MSTNILKKCPSCGSDLIISELSCQGCGIKISGNFAISGFSGLDADEWEFIKQFLLVEGNISKMQSDYNRSNGEVKSLLNTISIKLGGEKMIDKMELTAMSNGSKVIQTLQDKIIAHGGQALMPVLKGEPVPFWLSSTKGGFESKGLRGVVLEWRIFDAIVKKAISLGGKMYRGDSAAHNGSKIGSDDLPLDTIDGYISTEFYGAHIGDTTLRRSTYYSGILDWAGIAVNHRSQGRGGFITINPEFMNGDDE